MNRTGISHIEDLPYALHTGRELELMLLGAKPLACFSDEYPREPRERAIPELAFAPHVASGRFQKREYVRLLQMQPPAERRYLKGFRQVFYAAVDEDWRIDAMIELQMQAEIVGWTEQCERKEGSLLGYEEWQTDAWIESLRKSAHASQLPWLQAVRHP